MSRPKGTPRTGGRLKGTPNRRTTEALRRAEELAIAGETPLSIMVTTARELWRRATLGGEIDLALAREASQIASMCAPYVHPRLSAIAVEQRPWSHLSAADLDAQIIAMMSNMGMIDGHGTIARLVAPIEAGGVGSVGTNGAVPGAVTGEIEE